MIHDRTRWTITGLAFLLIVGIAVGVIGFLLVAIDVATDGESGGSLQTVGGGMLIGGAVVVTIAAVALLAYALRVHGRDRADDG